MDKIVIKFKDTIRVNASFYLKFDDETGKLQLLAGKDSEVLSEVDLPTEKIITNAFYDDTTKELVIDFESANQVRIPIDFTDEIESAINEFESRFNTQFSQFKESVNTSFQEVNQKIDDLEKEINTNINSQVETLNQKVDTLEDTINNNIGKQVESLNKSIEEINNSKVDKVDGKQLSTNDLTNELLQLLQDKYTKEETNKLVNDLDVDLQKQIDDIKVILNSDDVDLDTLQELVNALKNNVASINDIFTLLSQKTNKTDFESYKQEVNKALSEIEPEAIIDVSSIDGLGVTPVPESGLVEKVYFNTQLPLEETLAIFDSLNFVLLDETETEKYYVWACLTDESMQQSMVEIMKLEETYSEGIHTTYTIMAVSNGSTLESAIRQNIFEWSSVNGIDSSFYGENGWLKDFDGTGEFNIENDLSVVSSFLGFTPENNKAVKLFSLSPFIEISEQVLYRVSEVANGTVVPNTDYVENIYFNTSLSVEDVVSLLETAQTEMGGAYFLLATEDMTQMITAIKDNPDDANPDLQFWTIGSLLTGTVYFSEHSYYDDDFGNVDVGWNPNVTYPISINSNVVPVINMDGEVPFGTYNDKLTQLFSTTSFIATTPKLYHIKNGEKYQIRTAPIIDVEELPQDVPSENIAVPYDTKVDTIYFNTDLSIDEVKAIIDKVYASKPSSTGYWFPFLYQNDDGTVQKMIIIAPDYAIGYGEIINGDVNQSVFFDTTNGWLKGNFSINEINNFPSHNEHDYDEYALNVLGQELVYTKSKEIKADIDTKSLYRVTEKDTGGIVVPNTGYVENIYFNISLSVEEVVSYLETLSLGTIADLTGYIFLSDESGTGALIVALYQDGVWLLTDFTSGIYFFISDTIEGAPFEFVGWNPDISYPYVINSNVENIFQSANVGAENDKLIDLISTNNSFGIKKGSSKLYHFANGEWLELGNSANSGNNDEKINQIEERLQENETKVSENTNEISNIKSKNESQDTNISNAQQTANEALAIAKGRAKATVFDTYLSMIEHLKNANNNEFNIGDNLLIKELNVPDYWVSAILETNDGIYGYYEVSLLETQKVDLTNYYDITKTNELLNKKLDSAIELTYSELKTLRDNSQLVVGATYIINDYTYVPPFSVPFVSGNHIFDIILIADSENTLNENARARKHEGDTYFANNDLSVWELKYTLENNKNGRSSDKGVIYWLKDEFDNECSYDFKNILLPKSMLYKNDKLNSSIDYYYTFSIINSSDNTVIDSSISKNNNVYQNKICSTSITNVFIGNNYYRNTLVDCKNVVINYSYSNDNFFSQVNSLFVGNSNYIRQCTLKDCLEIILNGLDYSNFTRVQYCNNTSMVHSFNVSKVGGTSENYLNFSKIQVNYKTPTNVTVGSVLEQYQNYGKIHAYWVDNETLQIVGKYLESNSDTEWKEITNN